ncbi:MAG: alanine--tRNA ligase [Chlamydiia bacterium]|nr:alanine--tRNA ligase [Chlamydiia bacterium]
MKTYELVEKFNGCFSLKGYREYASSSVLPPEDKSILFANAGMNQFKKIFDESLQYDCDKAFSIQKCIRAGGKDSDLENVGNTAIHLTYFEMAGSFIFNERSPAELAIDDIWEFLTKDLCMDRKDLWITVHEDDKETAVYWQKYVEISRIVLMTSKDNFWAMGAAGPCGMCTEILFDRGIKFGDADSPKNDYLGQRFLEIWNIVIMSKNVSQSGKISNISKKKIDTGAGLERLAVAVNGYDSVFDTDRFKVIQSSLENIFGKTNDAKKTKAYNIIADHISCCVIAISDGVYPGNGDRGYIVKKILRRAFKYAYECLGARESSISDIVDQVISAINADIAGRVKESKIESIVSSVKYEEEKFFSQKRKAQSIFDRVLEEHNEDGGVLSGRSSFMLKDTYGVDLDDIIHMAKIKNMDVNLNEFNDEMKKAKILSQSKIDNDNLSMFSTDHVSDFVGYENSQCNSIVVGLFKEDGSALECLVEGDVGLIILDRTPFYAEQGGQICDKGIIKNLGVESNVIKVSLIEGACVHKIEVGSKISVGDEVSAEVHFDYRISNSRAHTATHILHHALSDVLETKVLQAGSRVGEDSLRFDFVFDRALSDTDITNIERLVCYEIMKNSPVEVSIQEMSDIRKRDDVHQAFDGKYGDKVRLVEIGSSKELCGGTHCKQSGDIGFFRILGERSSSSGIRRIEAVTGLKAYESFKGDYNILESSKSAAKCIKSNDLVSRILALQNNYKESKAINNRLLEENSSMVVKELQANKSWIKERFSYKKIENLKFAKSITKPISEMFDESNSNRPFLYALFSPEKSVTKICLVFKNIRKNNIEDLVSKNLGSRARISGCFCDFVANEDRNKTIEIINKFVNNIT